MTNTYPSPKFVVVGSTAVDYISIWPTKEREPRDLPSHQDDAFGGGGTNASIALALMCKAEGITPQIDLFTRVGSKKFYPASETGYTKDIRNSFREDYLAEMEIYSVTVHDTACERPHRIPFNVVDCYPHDRFINRDLKTNKINGFFNAASAPLPEIVAAQLRQKIEDADAVIIFGSYGNEAIMAAQVAAEVSQRRKVNDPDRPLSIVVDYDVTTPERSVLAKSILMSATHIVAPGEALAPGMTERNDKLLFSTIVNDPIYTARVTAVSDAGNAVLANYNYNDILVEPGRVVKVIDSLGAGDTRTAKMALEAVKKTPDRQAIQYANRVATFSTQFLGRTWADHLPVFYQSPQYLDETPQEPVGLHLVAA
jgi:sugar/nucleoside kinase (ribokinase family)